MQPLPTASKTYRVNAAMGAAGPRCGGFTLIELLVAISIMALMAVLSWRGLDAMSHTQTRLQQRADEGLALQAGLAQWGADLDALQVLPTLQALDWDGRALRLTRRASASAAGRGPAEAVMVVAWSRRDGEGGPQWLRWQSPPLQTRGEVQTAWAQAAQWAQNPGDDLKAREVRVVPLAQWQIFFFRSDAWTNPLSAAGNSATGAGANTSGSTPPSAGSIAANVAAAVAALPAQTGIDTSVPQGVRLVLTLPEGQAISGSLTRDWMQPTLGGGKS